MIISMESLRDVIGKNFKKMLAERPDIKATQIAEAAEVHPSMIYKWKDGINIPEPEKMEAIAKLFGVDVMEFYNTGTGVISIRPSRALKKYLVIPDDIVEDLSTFEPGEEVWKMIRGAIEAQKEANTRKAKAKKDL